MHQSAKLNATVGAAHFQRKSYYRRMNESRYLRQTLAEDLEKFIIGSRANRGIVKFAANENEHAVEGNPAKDIKKLVVLEFHSRKFSRTSLASHRSSQMQIDRV